MSKLTFEQRCLIAEQCLPDAPYRDMLKKLHTEMLEALAQQPAQQGWKLVPVDPTPEQIKEGNKLTWPLPCVQVYSSMLAAAPQPAQQEPVALLNAIRAEPTEMIHKWRVIDIIQSSPPQGIYYTPPAQRTWVGLTDEEIGLLYRAGWANNMDFARAVEAKLREKNAWPT